MILSSLNVVNYLQVKFPDILFYNGFIDRSQTKCAGLYIREGASPNIAIGGLDNTSYSTLPLTLLVHWTEDAEETQVKANDVYESLFGRLNFNMNSVNIKYIKMLDPCPINISRDEHNICEMVIRFEIIYER